MWENEMEFEDLDTTWKVWKYEKGQVKGSDNFKNANNKKIHLSSVHSEKMTDFNSGLIHYYGDWNVLWDDPLWEAQVVERPSHNLWLMQLFRFEKTGSRSAAKIAVLLQIDKDIF